MPKKAHTEEQIVAALQGGEQGEGGRGLPRACNIGAVNVAGRRPLTDLFVR